MSSGVVKVELEIIKCHGSGNDFLIIDEITNNYTFSEIQRAEIAKALCSRETELGADGILYLQKSDHADGVMRVFNTDGSEASMCGNGLRCAARYICGLLGKKEAIIETMKADLHVSEQENIFPDVTTFQVEISPVSFSLKDLPLILDQETLLNEKVSELSEELKFTAVAVPNPHLIAMVEEKHLQGDFQGELSSKLNGPNKWFPDGVNVSFVKSISKGNIYVRTFERGVGFTNACGTAMSASTLVTCLLGLNNLEEKVNVYNNGGMVQCIAHKYEDGYKIDLIGNATFMYRAGVTIDMDDYSFTTGPKADFGEQVSYGKLQSEVKQFLDTNMKG
nr:diaminopimelate epimerase [Neobacillus terrae]